MKYASVPESYYSGDAYKIAVTHCPEEQTFFGFFFLFPLWPN